MLRFFSILAAFVTLLTAFPAFARPTSLRTAEAAKSFCELSESKRSEEHAEEYDARRRTTAQQPFEVILTHGAAPVVQYDRITASLELNMPQGAVFAPGYAISPNITSIGFEMPEVAAQKLWARYAGGTVSLRVTMLPLAWSDYDHPLCREAGETTVIDGEVLTVQMIDEVGRPVATFRTPLGREMALMKQHRIRGYLAAGTPVVTISGLVPFPAGAEFDESLRDRMQSDLRAALYGCYLRGLKVNGRLQGALVLKLEPKETTVLVDSLHSDDMKGCVVEKAGTARPADVAGTLKATVIFRLEDASL